MLDDAIEYLKTLKLQLEVPLKSFTSIKLVLGLMLI